MGYIPPYTITEEMLDLVMQIAEDLGKIESVNNLEKFPRLRKVNQIKSVHSSLAIENNSLSIDEVASILNGKSVIGPIEEIKAAENAFIAYKEAEYINPYEVKDLLKIHALMMRDLVRESGAFRKGGEGVFNKDGKVLHIAPPAAMVQPLMNDLFTWAKNSNVNVIIKSCIFHYEFEYIHPFSDGNGRMGRLWQSLILSEWKSIFRWIPIETIILEKQIEYYEAIAKSTKEASCNAFILFMLKAILQTVTNIVKDAENQAEHISIYIRKLLSVLGEYPMSANEIMEELGLKNKDSFRKNYLNPALDAGIIALEFPAKPTSRNQRYYRTYLL